MELDDVLARLTIDADFRRRVRTNPAGELAGYRLSADDLAAVRAWLGRSDEPGPEVVLAAGSADRAAATDRPGATGDLFDGMLARPELARRIREDPASVADEGVLPMAEVRRLGALEVDPPGAERSLLRHRLSKSALFFGSGRARLDHSTGGTALHGQPGAHGESGVAGHKVPAQATRLAKTRRSNAMASIPSTPRPNPTPTTACAPCPLATCPIAFAQAA